jgi:hypothetical protein
MLTSWFVQIEGVNVPQSDSKAYSTKLRAVGKNYFVTLVSWIMYHIEWAVGTGWSVVYAGK